MEPLYSNSVPNTERDEMVMERYLQRPEEAANMKRTMGEEKGEEGKRKSKTSSKIPKTNQGMYYIIILYSMTLH